MYEYDVLEGETLPNKENINDLASMGWELVQIVPINDKVYVYVRRLKNGGN